MLQSGSHKGNQKIFIMELNENIIYQNLWDTLYQEKIQDGN